MSPDPLGAMLANPNSDSFSLMQSINWYGYCSNNPVNYVDPTGLDGGATVATGIIAVGVAAVAAIAGHTFRYLTDSEYKERQDNFWSGAGKAASQAASNVMNVVSDAAGWAAESYCDYLEWVGDKLTTNPIEAMNERMRDHFSQVNNDEDEEIPDILNPPDPTEGTIEITETPWIPPDIKPPGQEPPPGILGKILWFSGKVVEIIDNIKGSGN